MKKLLFGIALLPLLGGVALAQPAGLVQSPNAVQLTNGQMDGVTAGWSLFETDVSNTSWTQISVYAGALDPCSDCYLNISSMPLSIESRFGPSAPSPSP